MLYRGFGISKAVKQFRLTATLEIQMNIKKHAAPEHVIAYAYPTSTTAQRHGYGKVGCYTFTLAGEQKAFVTLEQAVKVSKDMGTLPGRWSIDHPFNVAFSSLQSNDCVDASCAA
jgi:hypothetical protein